MTGDRCSRVVATWFIVRFEVSSFKIDAEAAQPRLLANAGLGGDSTPRIDKRMTPKNFELQATQATPAVASNRGYPATLRTYPRTFETVSIACNCACYCQFSDRFLALMRTEHSRRDFLIGTLNFFTLELQWFST